MVNRSETLVLVHTQKCLIEIARVPSIFTSLVRFSTTSINGKGSLKASTATEAGSLNSKNCNKVGDECNLSRLVSPCFQTSLTRTLQEQSIATSSSNCLITLINGSPFSSPLTKIVLGGLKSQSWCKVKKERDVWSSCWFWKEFSDPDYGLSRTSSARILQFALFLWIDFFSKLVEHASIL